jgi:ribosomal protein S17E
MFNPESGPNEENLDESKRDDGIDIIESSSIAEEEISTKLQDNGSPKEKADEIAKKVIEKNNYNAVIYPEDSIQRKFNDRNQLLCLKDIGLASSQELEILDKLNLDIESSFNKTIGEIVSITNRDPKDIKNEIDGIVTENKIENLSEAKELITSGIIIRGFENSKDVPPMSANFIKDFLNNTFPKDFLKNNGVSRIIKSQDYYYNKNSFIETTGNRDTYLNEEMKLEAVDSLEKLKHVYKIRAKVGGDNYKETIRLGNFEFDNPSTLDHIKNLEIESEEKQNILYVLGTIAHEIAHKYEKKINLEEYQSLISEEDKVVSEYVNNHIKLYGSNKETIAMEDFAETIRIYVTNPKYLKENYPLRFSLIDKLSIAKVGGVLSLVFPDRFSSD